MEIPHEKQFDKDLITNTSSKLRLHRIQSSEPKAKLSVSGGRRQLLFSQAYYSATLTALAPHVSETPQSKRLPEHSYFRTLLHSIPFAASSLSAISFSLLVL